MKTSNKVIHFFGNVMMTNGHKGLAELASGKVDVDTLKPGEFACFVNKPFTAMKLLTAEGVLIYWKQPHHRLLYKDVVTTLPQFLKDANIGFSTEVQAAITRYYKKFLSKKSTRKVGSKLKVVTPAA